MFLIIPIVLPRENGGKLFDRVSLEQMSDNTRVELKDQYFEVFLPKSGANGYTPKRTRIRDAGNSELEPDKENYVDKILKRKPEDSITIERYDLGTFYVQKEVSPVKPRFLQFSTFTDKESYRDNPIYCRDVTGSVIIGIPAYRLGFLTREGNGSTSAMEDMLELIGVDKGNIDYVFPKCMASKCDDGPSKKGSDPDSTRLCRIIPVYMLPYVFEVCGPDVSSLNIGSHVCAALERRLEYNVNLLEQVNPNPVLEAHYVQLKFNNLSMIRILKTFLRDTRMESSENREAIETLTIVASENRRAIEKLTGVVTGLYEKLETDSSENRKAIENLTAIVAGLYHQMEADSGQLAKRKKPE